MSGKKRRFPSEGRESDIRSTKKAGSATTQSSVVLVDGLPPGCTVLELKSRLEIYGSISRTRVDGSTALVTFRSTHSAHAAVAAAVDPHFGIALRSHRVNVSLVANSMLGGLPPPPKLLHREISLTKHGIRSRRLNSSSSMSTQQTSTTEESFKGRVIVAYDDLL